MAHQTKVERIQIKIDGLNREKEKLENAIARVASRIDAETARLEGEKKAAELLAETEATPA